MNKNSSNGNFEQEMITVPKEKINDWAFMAFICGINISRMSAAQHTGCDEHELHVACRELCAKIRDGETTTIDSVLDHLSERPDLADVASQSDGDMRAIERDMAALLLACEEEYYRSEEFS